jgi:hypothetical protein
MWGSAPSQAAIVGLDGQSEDIDIEHICSTVHYIGHANEQIKILDSYLIDSQYFTAPFCFRLQYNNNMIFERTEMDSF